MAKDRTAEFHNTLLSIKSRTAVPKQNGKRDEAKQSLLTGGPGSTHPSAGPSVKGKGKGKGKEEGGKSEFGKMAAGIAKDINSTTLKLQKLAQRESFSSSPAQSRIAADASSVAKRKTLFDDRPIEISELTYIIRQDIASLNTQIASLQAYVRAQKGGSKSSGGSAGQVDEHNSNVVMLLQSRLANMGMGFKDVLELRTQVRRTMARGAVTTANIFAEHEGEQGPHRAVYAYCFEC